MVGYGMPVLWGSVRVGRHFRGSQCVSSLAACGSCSIGGIGTEQEAPADPLPHTAEKSGGARRVDGCVNRSHRIGCQKDLRAEIFQYGRDISKRRDLGEEFGHSGDRKAVQGDSVQRNIILQSACEDIACNAGRRSRWMLKGPYCSA